MWFVIEMPVDSADFIGGNWVCLTCYIIYFSCIANSVHPFCLLWHQLTGQVDNLRLLAKFPPSHYCWYYVFMWSYSWNFEPSVSEYFTALLKQLPTLGATECLHWFWWTRKQLTKHLCSFVSIRLLCSTHHCNILSERIWELGEKRMIVLHNKESYL
jgi:hypothetical protein